jgi:2-isopropylmalate synthase
MKRSGAEAPPRKAGPTMRAHIDIYDTTLRDGSQGEDISYSVEDKLAIAGELDALGVDYIEGGWPAIGNAKDQAFFRQAKKLRLKQARLVAFGSTRRVGEKPGQSLILKGILSAETRDVCLVGKTSDFHVTQVLRTNLDENLRIVHQSVAFMKKRRQRVFFDAEHFYDGFKRNPGYALQSLRAAHEAGADALVLCDTNGGSLPADIEFATAEVRKAFPGVVIGIHTHNDAELAVANSLAAVAQGARHVQGTINGYGERCGNANLVSLIPNLTLKMGFGTLPEKQIAKLTKVSRYVASVANLTLSDHQPYSGTSAFAHKAGLHIDALLKAPGSYEHMDPARVGNLRRLLASDQAGKAAIVRKFVDFDLVAGPEEAKAIIGLVKQRELDGYQYEGADASLELLVRRHLGKAKPVFKLLSWHVDVERRDAVAPTEVSLKLEVAGKVEHTVAEGNGPVNALDRALRKALLPHFPALKGVELVDFKVRVLGGKGGTSARVRVLIESRDPQGNSWSTVGVHENIIEACWEALHEAAEYKLMKAAKR